MIEFTVPGPPQGKDRPRFTRNGGVYTTNKTKDYESRIWFYAQRAMKGKKILDGPVFVRLWLDMPIPASWSKKKREQAIAGLHSPTTRPDIDNVIKVLFDAINNIVWLDDKQVTNVTVSKQYSEEPGITAKIREIGK